MTAPAATAGAGETAAAPGPGWLLGLWRLRVPVLATASGLLLGLAMPGIHLPVAWVLMLVPLFLALDVVMARPGTWWGRGLRALGACWWAGVMAAAIIGDWMVNTAHVYGGLSLPVAYLANWFGFGSLEGMEIFLSVGIPFVLAWGRPWWTLALVPVWSAAVQAHLPRMFMWTYGTFLEPLEPVVQAADLVGAAGLNLLAVPLQLVLYAWVRRWLHRPWLPRRPLVALTAAVALLFAAAAGYGWWRQGALAGHLASGAPVRLAALQPDFSLGRLASNPALSHSDREQSLETLLQDSEEALVELRRRGEGPVVVLWPESVYPGPYLLDRERRRVVEQWVRAREVHLVLASLDAEWGPGPRGRSELRHYGVAVHVPPAGGPPEVYRKIFLIPFGETIPLADWFPFYARWLKAWIPRISQFEAGSEHTVFAVNDGVRLAPMICYDATQSGIARGMRANGANLGLVLANLAWFGRTTVSDQFGFFVRWRARENRLPIALVSQNGRSVLIDALGRPASRRTGQYTTDALTLHLRAGDIPPTVFTRYGAAWYNALAALTVALALALGAVAWYRRRLRRRG